MSKLKFELIGYSDCGNRDLPEKRFSLQEGEENPDTIPDHVLAYAEKVGAKLIVRTFKFRQYSGAWYVKGKATTNYSDVRDIILTNLKYRKFASRKFWLIA